MKPTQKMRWLIVNVGNAPINSPFSQTPWKHRVAILQQWWSNTGDIYEIEGEWRDIPMEYSE